MQLLIVEDDKRISNFLVSGLEQQGYSVVLCKSAEDVLNNYLTSFFD